MEKFTRLVVVLCCALQHHNMTSHSPAPRIRLAVLVGVGDSSFHQHPCNTTVSSTTSAAAANCRNTTTARISQVACGATAAFALVSYTGSSGTPAGTAAADGNSRVLEWGTGMYGERLVPAPSELNQEPGARTPHSNEDNDQRSSQLRRLKHPTISPLTPPLGANEAVRLIACGAHFVVAALASGGCISWGGGGSDSDGRQRRSLGRGDCDDCLSCRGTPHANERVSTTTTPRLPVDGSNDNQQHSVHGGRPEWVKEPLGPRGREVIALAVGDDHAIAICKGGTTWAWGRGNCGQLGVGAPSQPLVDDGRCPTGSCRPVLVRMPLPPCGPMRSLRSGGGGGGGGSSGGGEGVIRAAACGRDHSAVLTASGRVFTFGSGLYGQLGIGTVGDRAWTPTPVDALDGVGTMLKDGTFTGMSSVACGAWHTAAVSTTGDVYTWGWARFGALGQEPGPLGPDKENRSRALEANAGGGGGGGFGTVKRSNSITFPDRADGAEVRPYPGLVDGLDSLIVNEEETGDDLDTIVSVGCGARYTLALSRKKRVYAWGQVSPGGEMTSGANASVADTSGGIDSSSGSVGNESCSKNDFLCRPHELVPAELLRRAEAQDTKAHDNGDGCCCGRADGRGAYTRAEVLRAEGEDGRRENDVTTGEPRRWTVSAAGCGPWYVVLGLQEIGGCREAPPDTLLAGSVIEKSTV